MKKYIRYFLQIFLATLFLHGFIPQKPLTASITEQLDFACEWAEKAEKKIIKRILPNGLTILFYPTIETSDVLLRLVVRAGSCHEATPGLAHLLEHMAFKGTTENGLHLSETDITALCEHHGLVFGRDVNAQTGGEYTGQDHARFFVERGVDVSFCHGGIEFSCLTSDFTDVTKRIFTILTQPTYAQKPFQHDRDDFINDFQKLMKSSAGISSDVSRLHLYKDYPWITDTATEVEQLKNYTIDELKAFHMHHVNPSMMTLVIVGNYDETTLQEHLDHISGQWLDNPNARNAHTTPIPEITPQPAKRFTRFLSQDLVTLTGFRLMIKKDDADEAALELLNRHLYKEIFALREQTGLFYGLSRSVLMRDREKDTPGHAFLTIEVAPENVELAQNCIKQALQSIVDNGVTEDKLHHLKNSIQNDFATYYTTTHDTARSLIFLLKNKRPYDYYETLLNKIKAVTPEDIKRVARTYLDPSTWSWVLVGRTIKNEG